MKEKSYLSAIVYLNSLTRHTHKFVTGLNTYLQNRFEHFEIILVNNNNKGDEYNKIVESIKENIGGHATIINLPWRQDIEASMLAGSDLSIGDFILEIDSLENINDLSIIDKLFKKCTEGFDIVAATPVEKKDLLSQWFYHFIKRFSNIDINLNSEPIRIITRRALNSALKSKEKVRFRQILYLLTGFSNTCIEYKPKNKYISNKSISEKISLALEIILSYTNFGLQLTFGLSFLFFLLSIGVGIYAFYVHLTFEQVARGWTTTMIFLSFGFTGFFLITGVITKYLAMVLLETKNRSPYTIQSIQKIK